MAWHFGIETARNLVKSWPHQKEEDSSHSELDIECPRCHEIMDLRSDFDVLALLYF